MFGDGTSDVFHETITNFYSVAVEDLVEFIFMWEVIFWEGILVRTYLLNGVIIHLISQFSPK